MVAKASSSKVHSLKVSVSCTSKGLRVSRNKVDSTDGGAEHRINEKPTLRRAGEANSVAFVDHNDLCYNGPP